MNKQGMEALGRIMIAVVTLILLVTIFTPWLRAGIRGLEEMDCTIQVYTHAATAKAGRNTYPRINCPTTNKTFEKDESNDKLLKTVAEEMRLCWKRWGQGKLELFQEDGTYCHYCSYIDFQSTKRPMKGLSNYLLKTEMPRTDVKYMDYLSPYASENADEKEEKLLLQNAKDKLEQEVHPADTPYTVMFVYGKGDTSFNRLMEYIDPFSDKKGSAKDAGAILGGVAGVTSSIATAKVASLAVIGASNPIGWAVIVGAGISVATYVSIEYVISQYDPADFSDVVTFVTFLPLRTEEIQSLGCTHIYATSYRTEGLYTDKEVITSWDPREE